MEAVRITAQGQITIPIGIRKKLNLKAGDKVIFIEEKGGRIFFENPALVAFNRIQNEMRDAAKDAGFNTEQELQNFASEVRQEMWKKYYAGND